LRRSFTEHTDQVPPRARPTARLRDAILDAVAGEVRAIDRVAGQFGVSWPTVQRLVDQAVAALAAWCRTHPRLVRHPGIDEHRFRSVRWFKDHAGAWRRIEPWMTTFVDLATDEVIDVVDGRGATVVAAWLSQQPRWWRRRVEVVAIDPSASFRSAVRRWLPKGRRSSTRCCASTTRPRRSAPPGASRKPLRLTLRSTTVEQARDRRRMLDLYVLGAHLPRLTR